MTTAAPNQRPSPHERAEKTRESDLRDRFGFWLTKTGTMPSQAARLLDRGVIEIQAYLDGGYKGNLKALEDDIAALLCRKDDGSFPYEDPGFVETTISKAIWGVLDYCRQGPSLGFVIGGSGLGKTRALQQYRRGHLADTILVTATIVTRSLGALLRLLAGGLRCSVYDRSNYGFEKAIIHELAREPRLIVIDDAHFLRWELFEVIRSIYDNSKAGVAFICQPRFYDQMLGGKKAYLWDQLASRVGIRYELEELEDRDIELVCRGIFPELEEKSLAYLCRRARGPGKLRAATKLLEKGIQVYVREGVPLDVNLLKEIDELTTLKGGQI